jgi:hypothetical protein
MKKFLKKTLILLYMGIIAGPLYGNTSENPWVLFINKPNESNYLMCRKMIEDSASMVLNQGLNAQIAPTPVKKNLISNYKLYDDFIMILKKRNPFAMDLAMKLYPFTDASATEDLCIALSATIEDDPISFLRLLKSNNIRDNREIECFITSRDPDEEDVEEDDEGYVAEIDDRIAVLSKVSEKDLLEIKAVCIDILRKNREYRMKIIEGLK